MGKTTLMKSLMGIVPATQGKMLLNNEDMTGFLSHERVSRGVAYVPQGRMIFPTMTVEENIETGLAASNRKTIPDEIYDLFPVLKEMRTRHGGNLSGGQQQQLAIARALVSEPKVLLLDEPTEGIQPSIIKELAQVLKRIRDERGLSILVSEQVLSFVMDASDRIMVIENGKIVHEDNRNDVNEDTIVKYLSV
jgi:urea transport system ATP-binding protein